MTIAQHAETTAPLYASLRAVSAARHQLGADHGALDLEAKRLHNALDAAHAAAGV